MARFGARSVLPASLQDLRTSVLLVCLHRFDSGPVPVRGAPLVELRAGITRFRARGWRIARLVDVLGELERGEPVVPTVALTIDDGYRDVSELAVPVLTELECPATVFLTTGFVDRETWLWWDQVEWALRRLPGRSLTVDLGDAVWRRSWPDCESGAATRSLVHAIEERGGAMVRSVLEQVERAIGSPIPKEPPDEYAAMSWEEARTLPARGIDVGPHSLTHPLLAGIPAADSEREIVGSWKRLRAEVPEAVPVFCYPGGGSEAFGEREATVVRDAGFVAALSMLRGPVWRSAYGDGLRRFALPRYGFSLRLVDFAWSPRAFPVVGVTEIGLGVARRALRARLPRRVDS